MPLTNFLTNPIATRDAGFPLYAWKNQVVQQPDGSIIGNTVGIAKITDTMQFAIPLVIPSDRKNKGDYADRPFIVPQGAQIIYAGIRLPGYPPANQEDIYGLLPAGVTMIGISGEHLKISPISGTTYSVAAPVIGGANSAYAPDASAVAYRPSGVADAATPSLLTTLAAATTYQITVSNNGDSAAGTGIRLSQAGAEAYITALIAWRTDGDMIRLGDIGYPYKP